MTQPITKKTIARVLRYLADNEGAGWLEVSFAWKLSDEIGDLDPDGNLPTAGAPDMEPVTQKPVKKRARSLFWLGLLGFDK